MSEHMKGRLTVRTIDESIGSIDHEDGTPIACAFQVTPRSEDLTQETRKANAARIVHTWNCHDDLLAALQEVRKCIDVSMINNSKGATARWTEIAQQIDDALAKAGQ